MLAPSPVAVSTPLTVDATPLAIGSGALAENKPGGGDLGSRPMTPPPGPGPGSPGGAGGAGGGAAAGSGSGSTSSAFFTLAGVLLQAAPRAMRRLLLAQSSWRTSFLVLIPERPD